MSTGEDLPTFKDPEAQFERFGFIDSYDRIRLPGLTWESGNMFNDTTFMPNCNMEDAVFNDTVWDNGADKNLRLHQEPPVLTEIFYSNPMRRLQAVEQLTLPPEYTTIPNTAAFSRFEHIWGSVLFVKQLAKKEGVIEDQVLSYQLRTLLSDMAHTTGSHIGDWLFQGVGEGEDQHDIELGEYLAVTGVTDILRKHHVEPETVILPEVSDWVEAPAPDLCVDRVDYGLREMNRWNDAVRHMALGVNDFTLTPENKLAMTDQRIARIFAEGYLLLSQEHWSEPTHRFLEEMLMLKTKLFYAQYGAPDTWVFTAPEEPAGLIPLHEMHPRDLMYVTDPTQAMSLARHNLGGNTLDAIMRNIAQYRRQYVWPGRRERIYSYMHQFTDPDSYSAILKSGSYIPLESEDFSTYLGEYPPYLPVGFTVLDTAETDSPSDPAYIDFPQPPFKTRQIDPLVQTGGGFERLSELDPSFAERLVEHEARIKQANIARLVIPDKQTNELIRGIVDNVESHWQERLTSSRRMNKNELRRLVDASSREIHGRYPFLSFLSY